MSIYKLLFEQDNKNVDTPEASLNATQTKIKARKALDSIDDQIDSLIIRYEASSIRETPVDDLMESLIYKKLKFLLEQEEFEEEEDSPPAAAGSESEAEASKGDAPAPDPVGSEKMTADDPGESLIPDLDIDAFAARTTRLIANYKSLLRMEEAIINRVKNFLDENYGDKFVQKYTDILEEQYGITLTEFEDSRQIKDDKFAVGAYAAGMGQSGGGG